MISGKEALIAKLNGEDVQFNLGGLDWQDLTDRELNYWQGERYLNADLNYKFRLKPQTITIEILEFNGSVSMAKYPESINIIFSNKDDCTRWHNTLQQIFK